MMTQGFSLIGVKAIQKASGFGQNFETGGTSAATHLYLKKYDSWSSDSDEIVKVDPDTNDKLNKESSFSYAIHPDDKPDKDDNEANSTSRQDSFSFPSAHLKDGSDEEQSD
jgi:hypothetical protein